MFDNEKTLTGSVTHVGIFNKKRKFGFTLAEVLVTLGIIGVVAVLTVPNVISSYQKKVYVAQLQKVYNQISNAVSLLMVDEEVDNLNDTSLYCNDNEDSAVCDERVGTFLKKYLKIQKDCGIAYENPGCFPESYKSLDGSLNQCIGEFSIYCVTINSGAIVCANSIDSSPLSFIIDINGMKKPNTWGRDAFSFDVNYKGEIAESFDPDVVSIEIHHPDRCIDSKGNSYNVGCFNKIIQDGWKMDY